MSVLNIVLLLSSYITYYNPIMPTNINRINKISMKDDEDYSMLNNSNKFTDGLKLFDAKTTKDTAIKWLHSTLDEGDKHPTFVVNDLVSTITYSIKEPEKYDLYIAYMPNRFEDPHFIGCFSVKPDRRLLSIEQICTNPFIEDTSLTDYKKKLKNLAATSGVVLYAQPLKYLINPRYYLEFSQYL